MLPACDKPAAIVTQARYGFPEALRVRGHPLEWVVVVAVRLSAQGRVESAAIRSSEGQTSLNPAIVRHDLNAEALREAQQSIYRSRIEHCKAVASVYYYRIIFTGGP